MAMAKAMPSTKAPSKVQRLKKARRALAQYQAKRSFDQTPEPSGGKAPAKDALRFCVQKHAASHLHYDFRLEVDGVLKSWAVPKGPSLQAGLRRLAMQVEDHPYDYRTFEGSIPKGQYGGGTVMLWDEGTYTLPGVEGRAETEAVMRRGLAKGHLSIELHGSKLEGGFALLRLPPKGEGSRAKASWLLVKKADAHASRNDVLAQDLSVSSGRSMEGIAQGLKKSLEARRRRPRP